MEAAAKCFLIGPAIESVSLAFRVCVCVQNLPCVCSTLKCPSALIKGPFIPPFLLLPDDSGFWRWCSNRSSWNSQLRRWISTGTRPRVWPRRQNTKPGQVLRCVIKVWLLKLSADTPVGTVTAAAAAAFRRAVDRKLTFHSCYLSR